MLALEATFSSAYYCGCVIYGHMTFETSVALNYSLLSDCKSDSVQSLFDLTLNLNHEVDIAPLRYEISSQLRPTHSHAADFLLLLEYPGTSFLRFKAISDESLFLIELANSSIQTINSGKGRKFSKVFMILE